MGRYNELSFLNTRSFYLLLFYSSILGAFLPNFERRFPGQIFLHIEIKFIS